MRAYPTAALGGLCPSTELAWWRRGDGDGEKRQYPVCGQDCEAYCSRIWALACQLGCGLWAVRRDMSRGMSQARFSQGGFQIMMGFYGSATRYMLKRTYTRHPGLIHKQRTGHVKHCRVLIEKFTLYSREGVCVCKKDVLQDNVRLLFKSCTVTTYYDRRELNRSNKRKESLYKRGGESG